MDDDSLCALKSNPTFLYLFRPERVQFKWAKKKRNNTVRPSKRDQEQQLPRQAQALQARDRLEAPPQLQQGQEMQQVLQDELPPSNQGLNLPMHRHIDDIETIETI